MSYALERSSAGGPGERREGEEREERREGEEREERREREEGKKGVE